MKLSDYRETFYEFSGKASDVTRQLAFAGIAIIWIFKIEDKQFPQIPSELLLPSITLALTLAFDLLQYVSAAIVWGIFQWYKERQLKNLSDDPDLDAPSILKLPQLTFFIFKIISVIFSYYLLVKYLAIVWFKT